MKKLLFLLILITGLSTVTGCWSSRELSESGILIAGAFEKAGKKDIRFYYQILDPKKLKQDEPEAKVILSSSGPTAHEATWRLINGLKRRLFISHTKAVIYSTELAKEGKVFRLMDAMNRDQQFRMNSYLYVANDPLNMLGTASPLEPISGIGLSKGAAAVENDVSEMISVTLREFMKDSLGPTGCAYTSFLKLHKESDPATTHVDIDGPAIFKNEKLVKIISSHKITRGMLWFENKVKGTSISLKIPEDPKYHAAIEVHSAGTKITPRIEDGKLVIDVAVESSGDINEWQSSRPLTIRSIELLEQAYQQEVVKEMEMALKKMQEEPVTDVLNIGLEVYRQQPKYWRKAHKDWDNIFKKLDVRIKVEAKIKNLGMVKDRKPDSPKPGLFPWSY